MSGIKISKAIYGSGSSTVDVTKTVMSNIKDGNLSLVVSPDSLGVQDPAPGQLKTLTVNYTINNGSAMTDAVKDNEVLMISAPPERTASGLQITKAQYGYSGNFTDVTDALQNQISNGSINIKVGPSTMGIPDPNPNKQKTLEVEYTINGSANSQSLVDGKTFRVSAPPVEGQSNASATDNVYSVVWILIKNALHFAAAYLFMVSVMTMMDLGGPEGMYRIALGVVGVCLPLVAFWGLPIFVFVRRLIYTDNLIA
jgi:hypothetical protein